VNDKTIPTEAEAAAKLSGAERIAAERKRQIEAEGWDAGHDDEHCVGDLLAAARAYCTAVWKQTDPSSGWTQEMVDEYILEQLWPWDESFWKPSADPVRNLEKAGALIAAEIDRLLRAREDLR
jgi:hypothetical protein